MNNSALKKARAHPESMKARILAAARQAFGELGFHGATTRHIAGLVGVDISTLHYHWGDKGDLFEAAVLDITEDLRQKLVEVERMIHGKPLAERLDIAIDQMTDYLFAHPEVSNLTLRRYFGQTRHEMTWDNHLPVFVNDIARSMGLAPMRGQVEKRAKMQVFAIMLAIYNFVSGGEFISHSLGLEREEYIPLVKQTLRFMLIPPFLSQTCPTQREQETPPNLT